MKKTEKGLTLPETIVVITIIVILIIAVLVYLRTQIFKGNDGKRKGDLHNIQVAVEEYEKDNNCYPLPSLVVCNPGTGLRPYISKIPCDPVTGASYYYEHEDSSCPSWYRIYTNLDNENDPAITGYCGPGYSFNYYVSSPNAPPADCIPVGGTGGSSGGSSGSGGVSQGFYGCFSGVCQPINWDPLRPGPECDPNYGNSTCYNQCTNPDTGESQNECTPWNN